MPQRFTHTDPYTFEALCAKFKVFLVPPFQRPYAWKPKNITELWSSMIDSPEEYFVGTIVCLDPTAKSDYRMVIIDGQQRMITTSLFFIVIRDILLNLLERGKNSKETPMIQDLIQEAEAYIFSKDRLDRANSGKIRIKPGKDNAIDIFNRLIERKIDPFDKDALKKLDDHQLRYIENYKVIKKLILEYIGKQRDLKKVREIMVKLRSLLFIAIVCASDTDAYKLFEGLNSTGMDLSVVDLLKNALLMSFQNSSRKLDAERNWNAMEDLFEKNKKAKLFTKFIRHQWISRLGYISNTGLFDAIKKQKLNGQADQSILSYTEELLDDAKAYIAFRCNEYHHILPARLSRSVEARINLFSFLDLHQVYEVVLAYYNRFLAGRVTEKQFILLLEKLWIFAFRVNLSSINPSDYEQAFARHCKEISGYTGKSVNKKIDAFIGELKVILGDETDSEFLANFPEKIAYTENGDNTLIRFVLEEIIKNENKTIKVAEPTIEHIIPQDPSMWGLNLAEVEPYLHKIGNLTLLDRSDNGSLQNAKLGEKIKKVFSRSPFKLNKDIELYEKKFSADRGSAVQERGADLAKLAVKIWKL